MSTKNNTKNALRALTGSALCLALCLVLPILTGSVKVIGKMLSPMHYPVLLCGFAFGWQYGLAVGFIAPLMRSFIFGMPALFPSAVGMAFELAAYGFFSGLFYRLFPKKFGWLYVDLILSMILGRLIWGGVRFLLAGFAGTTFPLSAFLAGAVTDAIPGIILQILLLPPLVMLLKKAKIIRDPNPRSAEDAQKD